MTLQDTFFKGKFITTILLIVFMGIGFAQDLHPSHNAYNSLTSVVDAMKLERKSCTEIGYYPQVGQAICASVPSAENFRADWDLIVNQTGSSFGLSPLGDWTSEPARGIIHRTYLLGSTDLKVNYDVISSRITIDVLDPELQVQEEARRVAQAEAEAAQQQAQAAYDAQQVQATYDAQYVAQHDAQQAQINQTQQTVNGYDVSAAYPAQQAQTTEAATGYYATNADGTTFALVDSATTNSAVTNAQTVTTQQEPYTADYAQQTAVIDSRSYAPAVQAGYEQTTTAQVQNTVNNTATDGYASTVNSNYAQTSTDVYQAAAQNQAVQAVQAVQNQATTIAYAYTPTNLLTAMGNSAQNSQAFQPNGAWQITSSGEAVTIELYDTNTRSLLRTVYPDQVYTDSGNYYLSISGNAAWALSVWTE